MAQIWVSMRLRIPARTRACELRNARGRSRCRGPSQERLTPLQFTSGRARGAPADLLEGQPFRGKKLDLPIAFFIGAEQIENDVTDTAA